MRIGSSFARLFGVTGCEFLDAYQRASDTREQQLAQEAEDPDRQERCFAAASLLLQHATSVELGSYGERELLHIVNAATEAMGARLSPARPWLQPLVFTDPALQRRQELAGATLYLLHHGEPFMMSPCSRERIATIYGNILRSERH